MAKRITDLYTDDTTAGDVENIVGDEVLAFDPSPSSGEVVSKAMTIDQLKDIMVNPANVGTLQFAASTYSLNEGTTDTLINIIVTRDLGFTQAISVDWTLGGTAVENSQYTVNPTAGTLVFADNATVKTIEVTCLANALLSGDKTVTLTFTPGTFKKEGDNPVNPGVPEIVDDAIEGILSSTTLTLVDDNVTAAPAVFTMTLAAESLVANIAEVTGQVYTYWIIQENDSTVPTSGGTVGRVPTIYNVDSSWTAATLVTRIYTLYTSTDDSNYVQIGAAQTITPTTTQAVPQTPNDVNFPPLLNAPTSGPVTSNIIGISGLLAPTAISISGGTNAKYSKNFAAFTSTAGVIENNDTIALQQDASGSDDTPTTITVSLGLRDEDWTVTTAATGVVAGVISIVAATYSASEDAGTLAITLRNTGKTTNVAVGCRVSTLFDSEHHTAEPITNYVEKDAEVVLWDTAVTADQIVTIELVDNGEPLDNVGELVIDSGSEFGGATIDPALNATLFLITGTGTADAFPQDTGAEKLVVVRLRDAGVTVTDRSGHTWDEITDNGGSYRAQVLIPSFVNVGYTAESPSIDVPVNFVATGIHYVWIEGMSTSDVNDSCWVESDAEESNNKFTFSSNSGNYYYEDDDARTINITFLGLHILRIYKREQDNRVTRLFLSTDPNFTPDGNETDAVLAGGSSGVNLDNPTVPLGPPLIIDDKTPDPFPFGEKIDQLLSATNIESDAQPIIGINVVTEVAITSDPSGTAEYKIDDGSWVTAAGTLSVGSTVTVRLDASALNDTAVTMDLTVGTVAYPFTIITKSVSFIVLLPRTTTINVTTDDFVIDDDDVTVPAGSGPAVAIAAGVDNTTVFNSRLNAEGDHAIKAESDIGALTVDHSEITARYQGIRVKGASAFTVTYCNLENCETHIALYATGWGNVDISDNYFKNASLSATPGRGGNCVQFQWVTGPNIALARNICINEFGESNPEDIFSMYKSSGTAASPIHLLDNKIRGGGPSMSGSALQLGDRYGANYLAEGNIIYNGPQSGIGISGDANIVVRNNQLFNDAFLDHQNGGIITGYTRWKTALACEIDPTGVLCEPRIIASPTGIVVELNKVHWWQSPEFGNPVWELVPFFKVPIDFTPTPAGWSTNFFDTDDSQTSGLTSDIWDTAWDIRPVVISAP